MLYNVKNITNQTDRYYRTILIAAPSPSVFSAERASSPRRSSDRRPRSADIISYRRELYNNHGKIPAVSSKKNDKHNIRRMSITHKIGAVQTKSEKEDTADEIFCRISLFTESIEIYLDFLSVYF